MLQYRSSIDSDNKKRFSALLKMIAVVAFEEGILSIIATVDRFRI